MSVAAAAAVLLAVLVGASLGLLGSGGSILTMPLLVYVAGVPAPRAVGMSLVVVGVTAAAGSLAQARRGGFAGRTAAVFSAGGLGGALIGARITHLVPAAWLMVIFGALMIAAGHRMRRGHEPEAGAAPPTLGGQLAAGLVLGVLTGFLGVGGGFLIMPALVLFARIDIRRAVPTSLAIIAVNAAGGLAGQVRYVDLDWRLTLAMLASALIGMGAGSAIGARLPAARLPTVFAWTITGLGAVVLVREGIRLVGGV